MSTEEQRAGVKLTNLDQSLSPDAGATKRDLVISSIWDFMPIASRRWIVS